MNKLLKFLSKLSFKERKNIDNDIGLILAGKLDNLDIKKLKGFEELYRSKRGNIRIIFSMNKNEVRIIRIDRRNDKTYKDLR